MPDAPLTKEEEGQLLLLNVVQMVVTNQGRVRLLKSRNIPRGKIEIVMNDDDAATLQQLFGGEHG